MGAGRWGQNDGGRMISVVKIAFMACMWLISSIVLCGFSRGAIACNFLGLHDDKTAKLWRAFVPYSHYDGVRKWPYPNSDADSAAARLERLAGRPQFICGEKDQVEETRRYLGQHASKTNLTFASTGFRNHNDAWILRPSKTRQQLLEWLKTNTTSKPAGHKMPADR